MISKRGFLILFLSYGFFSNSYASFCSHLATQVNQDIQRGNLNQDTPSWMNLSWLKKHLGTPKKGLIKNFTTYKWTCPEADGSYLNFVVDNGKIVRVSGVYNNDNGNGMFGAALAQSTSDQPSATDQPNITPPPTTSTPSANAFLQPAMPGMQQSVDQAANSMIRDINSH